MRHTLSLPVVQSNPSALAYFRFGEVSGRMLLTNDAGQWHFLTKDDFTLFVGGSLSSGHPQYEALVEKGFVRDGMNIEALAQRVGRKKHFVGVGPHLHICITTLRCNQSCQYCHASRTDMDEVSTDMTMETAKQVVDQAMQSSSKYINFEFQGGEPTVNMPIIKFIVEYSREKNKYEGKILDHALVTDMTYMTEENAEWLIDNGVLICTSLDGPEEVHNYNRRWKTGTNAYEHVIRWMDYFNRRYIEKGLDPNVFHVDALMTTTRASTEHWKEIVDLYVERGLRSIHLRPLNPYGFAVGTWKAIGYTSEEYLDFYAKTLDYIIELNKQGVEICEGTASTFLMKMLTPDDPNFVDIRSPCGAGTGQVAYNYDGKIFTCDEGRMVSAMGNDVFQIGTLGETTYTDMIQHPTVKAMAVASLQDTLPSCDTCWNKPFCGVCPMHNYMQSGDIFGQRPRSPKCKEHYTISSLLFEKLVNDKDGQIEKIFRRWTMRRPREDAQSCRV
ncbi:MAG: His-Xaa-Ser system radical SAM maturase HxsB [Sandaracinaceae bacterium]|nr:His-Xaa-Ser system radical SAM maturase HxsB [Sandaracinaceae bacterium]